MSQHLRQEGTSTEWEASSSNAEAGFKSMLKLQRAAATLSRQSAAHLSGVGCFC